MSTIAWSQNVRVPQDVLFDVREPAGPGVTNATLFSDTVPALPGVAVISVLAYVFP